MGCYKAIMRFVGAWALLIVAVNAVHGQEGLKPGADTAGIKQIIRTADKTLNPDSAIALYDKALQLSIAVNYADGAKAALMTKGIKYSEKEDYVKSRECYIQAFPWCKKASDKQAVAWNYNNIGISYFNEGDYIKASQYYFTALQELKKATAGPTRMAVNIYNNLALINQRLNQTGKALAYYKQAEDIGRQGNYDYQLAIVLMNIGEYFNSIHKPDSSIKYFDEVMTISQQTDRVDLQAGANDDMGKAYIEMGSYQKAIPLLQLAISLSQNRYYYIVIDASYSLGDALCHTGKYKEAQAILENALQETKAHNSKDSYITSYTKLIEVYKATGQYKKASDYMDTLAVFKDSLTNSEKAKAIYQMEAKYTTAEKDKQLAQNQLLIAQQKNKIINKNIWIASIAGSILLLFVILVAIYRTGAHKQKLQAEQIKSLQQENTISILKGMVQGEENERRRLAGELHDGIGGILSAAMMRLMTIKHDHEAITTVPAYHEALDMLNQMGDEIRKTAHNLMPEVLLKQPLEDAIRGHCNHLQEGNALQIDLQVIGSFDKITQSAKLNIYRIVQELLKNIAQHAGANHVLVQLLMNEQLLTITVEDNGYGFDTNAIRKGIGLHNLQTRIDSMQGHFTIQSEPNKGTSIYIEFDADKITV